MDDERRLRETVESAIAEFEKGKHRGGHFRLKGGEWEKIKLKMFNLKILWLDHV